MAERNCRSRWEAGILTGDFAAVGLAEHGRKEADPVFPTLASQFRAQRRIAFARLASLPPSRVAQAQAQMNLGLGGGAPLPHLPLGRCCFGSSKGPPDIPAPRLEQQRHLHSVPALFSELKLSPVTPTNVHSACEALNAVEQSLQRVSQLPLSASSKPP
ncbi:hypothetical protein T439DRAFT_353512 [Meredithblackwellia eburnea MCA 4105]